jgi:hypothetical protein
MDCASICDGLWHNMIELSTLTFVPKLSKGFYFVAAWCIARFDHAWWGNCGVH